MEDEFLLEDKKRLPQGSFNMGFAHGISGVLSFLSLSLIKGIIVDGQNQAINRLSNWIWNKHLIGKKGLFWKDRISFEEETVGISDQGDLSIYFRDAWCYGTPGVTRALFLAGYALNDKKIQSESIEAFSDIFLRTREEWWLPDASFCHGLSGL